GRSIYFRDPAGNLVELVTPGIWGLPSGWGVGPGCRTGPSRPAGGSYSALFRPRQGADEASHGVQRFRPIPLFRPARCLARLEAVGAVSKPCNANGWRKLIAAYIFWIAKRVAFPLKNQRGRLERS